MKSKEKFLFHLFVFFALPWIFLFFVGFAAIAGLLF